jgi:hypothetical protein
MATGKEEFNPYDLEHIADIDKFITEREKILLFEPQKTKVRKIPKKGILAPEIKRDNKR